MEVLVLINIAIKAAMRGKPILTTSAMAMGLMSPGPILLSLSSTTACLHCLLKARLGCTRRCAHALSYTSRVSLDHLPAARGALPTPQKPWH